MAGWTPKSHWRREACRAGVKWLGDDEQDRGNAWLGVASGRCSRLQVWVGQIMLLPTRNLDSSRAITRDTAVGAHHDHHCMRVWMERPG